MSTIDHGEAAMYRVSYGNGQVSNTKSLADCRREIADAKARNDEHAATFRIQRYAGDGEWVRA